MVIKNVVAVLVVATCLQLGYSEPIPKKQDAEDDRSDSWSWESWDRSDLFDTPNKQDADDDGRDSLDRSPKKQHADADSWDRSDWYDSLDRSGLYGSDEDTRLRCSSKWQRFGGSEYLVCEGERRHSVAKTICRRAGGQLVTIESKAEFEFVVGTYRRETTNGDSFWTSACKSNRKFLWPGGRQLSLNDPLWCHDEPDDIRDPTENGVVIEYEDGRWCYTVESQSDDADFICERKI